MYFDIWLPFLKQTGGDNDRKILEFNAYFAVIAPQKWAFMKHVIRHRRNITYIAPVAAKLRSAQAHDAQE